MSAIEVVEMLEFVWWVPLFIYSCIFIPALLRIRKIHINLRVLMCNVILDCLLSVGSRLILRIMERAVGTSYVSCTILSFINVMFLVSGTGTLLFLCLERFTATRFRSTYENMGGSLSVCSLIVKYLLASGLTVFIIFHGKIEKDDIYECSFVDSNPGTVIFIYLLGIVSFLFGLVISLFLYAFNVRKQKAIGDNLSTRFQFKENIAATRMLSYQMQCYFGISLIGTPVSVVNYFIKGQSNTQMLFDLLNQAPFILYLFYLSFYLLHVTFYYDPFFLSLTKNLMNKYCCTVPLDELEKERLPVDVEGDVYFKQMANMWDLPATDPNLKSRSSKKMFSK